MKFYLGTNQPRWLWQLTDVPLFLSRRELMRRKTPFPAATTSWALDSGGFTELSMFGEWQTSPQAYIADVRRYWDELGPMDWASPQDWMCEPWITAKTGKTVVEHQRLTVENYLTLRDLAPDLPFVPVLQGWELDDYKRHVDAYAAAGVDLVAAPTVGIGSVCRRQHTGQIEQVIATVAATGIRLHGFGLKLTGLRVAAHLLQSADSMAWSFAGRRTPATCGGRHQNEASCLTFALAWHARVAAAVNAPKQLSLESVA